MLCLVQLQPLDFALYLLLRGEISYRFFGPAESRPGLRARVAGPFLSRGAAVVDKLCRHKSWGLMHVEAS